MSAERVHPAIASEVATYDSLIANPQGIFRRYPVLHAALAAQRDFMANRAQIWAWNFAGGTGKLNHLMRVEGGEIVESLWQTLRSGQKVDGRTSEEMADYEIFAAQRASLPMVGGEHLGKWSEMEIAASLWGIRFLMKLFPGLTDDPGVVKAKVKLNEQNYPVRPNSAPHIFGRPQMVTLHEVLRPQQKALRDEMPGRTRKMDLAVRDGLEERRESPPDLIGAGANYVQTYLRVIETMVEYDL